MDFTPYLNLFKLNFARAEVDEYLASGQASTLGMNMHFLSGLTREFPAQTKNLAVATNELFSQPDLSDTTIGLEPICIIVRESSCF